MYRYFFILLPIIFLAYSSKTQDISMPVQTSYPCQSVDVPIVLDVINNVGAITLYIEYDANVMQCTGQTQGTLTNPYFITTTDNPIPISWSNGAASIGDTLLTLHFDYWGGSSAVEFANGCEISSSIVPFDPINVNYVDGNVGPVALKTFYVDHNVGSSGDGLSWATALKRISEATNKPLSQGDKVLIMPGNYNDTVIIKSNGYEAVPLTFNVAVSDTNKITFPASSDLDCIDTEGYPGSYYAYVYRSWKGNNGAYKITSVNKAAKYVIVEGAAFVPETGAAADSSLLQASIAMPVIYQKYSTNPEPERITLTSGISSARAGVYIGKILGDGAFNVAPANYNIVDGIDVTATATKYGVRIQNSSHNLYQNSRISELDSIGIQISGNTANPANHNFILNNKIYNANRKAIKIGIQNQSSANNRANINHIKGNEIYSTTSGSYINYVNAIEITQHTGYTVLENNIIRNLKLKESLRGAVEIRNNVRRVLAYSNYLKNIDRVTTGTHAVFYLQNLGNNNNVYNNVIVDTVPLANQVFAFWVNVDGGYTGGKIAYNTVHHVDRAFNLVSGSTNVDFEIKNNIMNIEPTTPVYFQISGTGLFNVSYNCYTPGLITAYPGETGRISGNPSFLSPAAYQGPYGFSLMTGSICLNTGNPVGGINTDFRGMTRSGTTPSRGAFEQVITGTYWTGDVNTNWHDYRNWDIQLVPMSSFHVTVPDRANDPVISSNNVMIKSLQVHSSAQVRVNSPRTLTLTN